MEDIIILVITALISSIVGGLVSQAKDTILLLSKRNRDTKKQEEYKQELRDAALRELMAGQLIDMHNRYVEQSVPMSIEDYERAEKIYHIYHDGFGGNGMGTLLYNEIVEERKRNH